MHSTPKLKVHFSDYFGISPADLDSAGAFNISLINDLPLFIDPFLLFNSKDPNYNALHDEMIRYLRFLRDKSLAGTIPQGLLSVWFVFSEVKQTWLGFSRVGNAGRGLGSDFAMALRKNLRTVFSDFGAETVTRGAHLEKLCLIGEGVGRDNISDFTTNLIKPFLLGFTQEIASQLIDPRMRRSIPIPRVRFNYSTETWEAGTYDLPYLDGDYIILTPKNMLTKDEAWINRQDMVRDFPDILTALPDEQLRAQLNNYLLKHLPDKPTSAEKRAAIARTVREFPQYVEYYIRHKEDRGALATSISQRNVAETETLFVTRVRILVSGLATETSFYSIPGDTIEEARARVMYLKDVIENKGGFRLFYLDGQPIRREADLHILFRLTWFATPSDVSTEVNDGRGPADFKISRGAFDKSIIEFKLASNPQLKRNLENQVEIYKRASDAASALKVIVYFTAEELERALTILRDLGIEGNKDIILIDARRDNKPSGSKA
jgi:hypothetical protein